MDTSLAKRNTTEGLADNGLVKSPSQPSALINKPMIPRQYLTLEKLNPLLQCQICSGYLVDATKLTYCNHTFCRACVWKELENSKSNCQCKAKPNCKCLVCPVEGCTSVINKLNPSASLKPDTTLQDIVYKLVPGLYKNEMKRRKLFYIKNKDADLDKLSQEERGEIPENRVYYTVEDKISLSIEYGLGENQMPTCELAGTSSNDSSRNSQLMPSSSTENSNSSSSFKNIEQEAAASRRYLYAPAGFSVELLKKFVLSKFDLPNTKYKAQVFYLEDELDDDLSLMDIAYIYGWKRMAPLRLFYRFIPLHPKASKLNKLRASQTSSVANSQPSTSGTALVINSNHKTNDQTTHQQSISHQTNNFQPPAKKPKIELSPIAKPVATTSLNPRTQQPIQQNRNSALQSQPMRQSPVQQTLSRASPAQLNSSPLARVSPNPNNNSGNLVIQNAKQQSTSSNLQQQRQQQMFNQFSQQAKASSISASSNSLSPNQNNNNNKLNLSSMKRTISKTKLNSTSQLSTLDQLQDYEPASKYRRILPASNSAFVSTQQRKEFAKPVVTMPNQANSFNNLNNYQHQHHQNQQQQQQHQNQQQQRKQISNLNAAKNLNQLNQAAQLKMTNVNHSNSTLNSISSSFNTLNNLNNLHFNDINSFHKLLNTSSTITSSSSTVTSLRNVRVPSTEKKKISNSTPQIVNKNIQSSLSSQTNNSNSISNRYNLQFSTGIPPFSNTNKANKNLPSKSFTMSSILEGSNVSISKKEDKPAEILSLNSTSLNTLTQTLQTAVALNNLNNQLNNSPVSPTSSLNHKRKSSSDRSPTTEFSSSLTEKGVKIFRNGLSSPTGSNSGGSLNSSLSASPNSINNNFNKINSLDKYLPVTSKPSSNTSPNEKKFSISQSKVSVEKPLSIQSNQFKSQQQNQLKQQEQNRQEEAKKPNTPTNKLSTTNHSMNSLNAVTNTIVGSTQITTKKSPALLEAVGLSKTTSATNHSKKISLDTIVNNLSIRNNQTSTAKNTAAIANNQSSSLSFAQAVQNGLKNATEQKSSKNDSTSINSTSKSASPKPASDSLTIKLPVRNGINLESNSNQQLQSNKRSDSPATTSNSKETNSKSLFLNSKIEVIEEDESPKQQESDSAKKETCAEQVVSDVEIDMDDDDSMDRNLVIAIPEIENSCSSSAPDDKLNSTNSNIEKSTSLQQTAVLKPQIQNQSLCVIQANTPPSSSPDFSKKFLSSRSNSPISSIGDEKVKTSPKISAESTETETNQKTKQPKLTSADPVSPPLTPSPRLCETQNINRENNFGALDLSTGPRKTTSPINIPTQKIAEIV